MIEFIRLARCVCLTVLFTLSAARCTDALAEQAAGRDIADPGAIRLSAVLAADTQYRRSQTSAATGSPLLLVAEGRPSAAVIDQARRSAGLPASARAVGWRLVEDRGRSFWKIIFRVGNRQVAVEVPAGR